MVIKLTKKELVRLLKGYMGLKDDTEVYIEEVPEDSDIQVYISKETKKKESLIALTNFYMTISPGLSLIEARKKMEQNEDTNIKCFDAREKAVQYVEGLPEGKTYLSIRGTVSDDHELRI